MCEQCDDILGGHGHTRRRLVFGGAAAGALLLAPAAALAARPRALELYHTHTGEKLRVTYAEGNHHLPDALEEISRFLRDFRSGEAHPIDPGVLDILHRVQELTGGRGPYEIISAYRSPQTNQMLRNNSSGVAQRSLHMEGKAIDVRLRGVDTRQLREAALGLQAGGVGYYRDSDFVHVDTGRVRYW
ncbi:DUF882 domain-containing protein [Thioalkalivibrio sp. XN279]|uniref:YcbK family protein n=1 Tax=Thioalkalivibrio sp. XN279 TaxID=2714953 RepID=UPI00140AC286|nr:DUF882 domain-containing protein [Thioalkalivibrio sp. XN279]NHA13481.1 DUF882 domain-containing protein [Thioalkalivibrio sp. XN279]